MWWPWWLLRKIFEHRKSVGGDDERWETVCEVSWNGHWGVSYTYLPHSGLHKWMVRVSAFLLFSQQQQLLLSQVRLFASPWTAACQASLSITISLSLLKLMSIESVDMTCLLLRKAVTSIKNCDSAGSPNQISILLVKKIQWNSNEQPVSKKLLLTLLIFQTTQIYHPHKNSSLGTCGIGIPHLKEWALSAKFVVQTFYQINLILPLISVTKSEMHSAVKSH